MGYTYSSSTVVSSRTIVGSSAVVSLALGRLCLLRLLGLLRFLGLLRLLGRRLAVGCVARGRLASTSCTGGCCAGCRSYTRSYDILVQELLLSHAGWEHTLCLCCFASSARSRRGARSLVVSRSLVVVGLGLAGAAKETADEILDAASTCGTACSFALASGQTGKELVELTLLDVAGVGHEVRWQSSIVAIVLDVN